MSEPLTPEREAEIRAREAKATEGRWHVMHEMFDGKPLRAAIAYRDGRAACWCHVAEIDLDQEGCIGFPGKEEAEANADFMAHARQDVPDLLAELDRLRAVLAGVEERLKREQAKKPAPSLEELKQLVKTLPGNDLQFLRNHIDDWSAKRCGMKRPDSEPERQELRALFKPEETEPCCECLQDYPKADLVIDGEIYCPKCREGQPK